MTLLRGRFYTASSLWGFSLNSQMGINIGMF